MHSPDSVAYLTRWRMSTILYIKYKLYRKED